MQAVIGRMIGFADDGAVRFVPGPGGVAKIAHGDGTGGLYGIAKQFEVGCVVLLFGHR